MTLIPYPQFIPKKLNSRLNHSLFAATTSTLAVVSWPSKGFANSTDLQTRNVKLDMPTISKAGQTELLHSFAILLILTPSR
jgi:hypothetical protein